MLYLLDANILIRAHADYYALDRVPQFWEWLLHHGAAGAVKVPQETYDEMAGGQPRPGDLLVQFLKRPNVKRALILKEDVGAHELAIVLSRGYGLAEPNDQDLEEMGKDPFLIAYALADPRVRCVVTAEVSKRTRTGARAKVPDVCEDVGVMAIGPFAFFKKLDFAIGWADRLDTRGRP